MKKIIIIFVLALAFGFECSAQTQTMYATSGHWFNFSRANYTLAKEDLTLIVTNLQAGKNTGMFSSGVMYQSLHSKEWLDLTLKCFNKANSSVINVADLLLAIDDSDVLLWSDDFSIKTTNYYWGTNGVTSILNYTGLGMNVTILVHGGYPTMKLSGCGNPLLPEIPEPVVVETPSKTNEVQVVIQPVQQPTQNKYPDNPYGDQMRRQDEVNAMNAQQGQTNVWIKQGVAGSGADFTPYQERWEPNEYQKQNFRQHVANCTPQANSNNTNVTSRPVGYGFNGTTNAGVAVGSGTNGNNNGNNGNNGNNSGNGNGSGGRP
jgi:hypothetical protein